MNKYNTRRIGEEYISNEGYTLKIVGGGTRENYCLVEVDGKYQVEVIYDSVKKGAVKNMYHPSKKGIGYFGIGEYKSTHKKKKTVEYVRWCGMLERCYDEKFQERQPTYKGCSVDSKWHNFQNFAAWCRENYVEGWQLDKDLLVENNKIYSEATCVFIPAWLNAIVNTGDKRSVVGKSGKRGVIWCNQRNMWKVCISLEGVPKTLGFFDSISEASFVYETAHRDRLRDAKIRLVMENERLNYRVLDGIDRLIKKQDVTIREMCK